MFFDTAATKFNVIGVYHMHCPKRQVSEIGNGNPYYAITYRMKSKSIFSFDNKDLLVNAQSIVCIPPDIKFGRNALEDDDLITIHFEIDDKAKKEINIFYSKNPLLYERLFAEIYQIYKAKNFGYKLKCNEYLYRIIYLILNEEMQQENYGNLSIAERAAQIIEKEISNSAFSVDSIAEMFKISKTHLRVLFNNFYEISPKEYQIKTRMQLAETLIRTDYFSVKQIAVQCGYEDEKYFSTSFKKYFGVSPKKF